MAMAHLTNDAYAFMLPALLPLLLGKLGIGLGLGGVLITLYQVSSSVGQPIFGHLSDGGGRTRWMAWSGVALSGIAAATLGLAPSVAAVAIALLVGGMGSALYHPVSAALVAGSVPPRSRGRWMSVYISAGNFGLPVGPFLIGTIIATVGLDGSWLVAIPALVLAALVWRIGPHLPARTSAPLPLRAVLRSNRRMLVGLVSVSATRAWATALVGSFLPVYAVSRGATIVDASRLLTLYLLAGAIGGLAGGWLADRVGRDRVITTSLVCAAPFCALLALQNDVGPAFVLATALSGLLLNGSFVVLTVRGQESMPGSLGMVSGLMLGLSIGVGGVAVAPMAIVAEHAGIPPLLIAAGALSLLCALLMRAVPRVPVRAEAAPAGSAG
ncbi:MAG: transporter, family, fosmidomycin resistance protein [Chloroflexota bacterium]|nr:transporter, family, fosmidomycin resistance protein [Chloroflexota bacterium]